MQQQVVQKEINMDQIQIGSGGFRYCALIKVR